MRSQIPTNLYIKDSLIIRNITVQEDYLIQMETFTKVIGYKASEKDMVSLFLWLIRLFTMDNGVMVKSMEWVEKLLIMANTLLLLRDSS